MKASESLAGASSEFISNRYNNCANRCYYACFQAAVAALQRAGIAPRGAANHWSHAFVPSQFDGQLINRRKLYPVALCGTLALTYSRRQVADYSAGAVSRTQAERMLRRTQAFVQAVAAGGGEVQ